MQSIYIHALLCYDYYSCTRLVDIHFKFGLEGLSLACCAIILRIKWISKATNYSPIEIYQLKLILLEILKEKNKIKKLSYQNQLFCVRGWI